MRIGIVLLLAALMAAAIGGLLMAPTCKGSDGYAIGHALKVAGC